MSDTRAKAVEYLMNLFKADGMTEEEATALVTAGRDGVLEQHYPNLERAGLITQDRRGWSLTTKATSALVSTGHFQFPPWNTGNRERQ